jgi:hypothetical protein
MPSLTSGDKIKLLNLQLLIARAAQKDSLNWWEDDSLTSAGNYVLERLFLHAPSEAGRKLALRSARSRYHAAFRDMQKAVHLFRLDSRREIKPSLHEISISNLDIPLDPIASLDTLRELLLQMIGTEPQYQVIAERGDHRIEIRPHKKISQADVIQLAQILAWSTLEGKPGVPVFPFIRNHS